MVRNPGRLLAPIAIAAVAVGAWIIVESNVGGHPHSRSIVHSTAQHVSPRRRSVARHVTAATFYTVRAGDTMSQIAAATHVPLARLESLNPSLGPSYTLHTGQRLRLRR